MWVLDLFLFKRAAEDSCHLIYISVLSMLDINKIKFVQLVCFGYEYNYSQTSYNLKASGGILFTCEQELLIICTSCTEKYILCIIEL